MNNEGDQGLRVGAGLTTIGWKHKIRNQWGRGEDELNSNSLVNETDEKGGSVKNEKTKTNCS